MGLPPVTSSQIWRIGFALLLWGLREVEAGVLKVPSDGKEPVLAMGKPFLENAVITTNTSLTSEHNNQRFHNKHNHKDLSQGALVNLYGDDEQESTFEHTEQVLIVDFEHLESEHLLGRRVLFTCLAKGKPKPQVVWLRANLLVYPHNYLQVHSWEAEEDVTRSVLIVDPATWMDKGFYECRAFNGVTSHSKTFFLNFGDALEEASFPR